MAKNNGKSKALTGILCFIFGFIFALIAVVGAVAIGVYYLLRTNIDDILDAVGVENTDSEGNKIYINTNEVATITDLISSLSSLVGGGFESLTIGELENIFPVAGTLVDSVYSALANIFSSNGITADDIREIIDEEELKNTPLSELGDFLMESFRGAEVQTVFRLVGIDPEDNVLYRSAAYGAEASVICSGDGSVTVLYADTFTEADGVYVRSSDGASLDVEFEDYLVLSGNETEYNLYYAVSDGGAYVAEENDGEFALTDVEYTLYDEALAELSGGYYYSDGELVLTRSPRTIGDLLDDEDGLLSAFSDVYINEIIADGGYNADSLLLIMFEGITIGDLLDSKVEFMSLIDRIALSDIIDISVDNALMVYIGFALTNVAAAADGEDYSYTGVYHTTSEDGQSITYDAYIVTDGDIITAVYYYDDDERVYVETSMGDVSTRIDGLKNDLTIGDIIGIEETNTVLYALRNSTINSLADDIQNLSLQEIFAGNIYTTDIYAVNEANFYEEYLYYYYNDGDYVLVEYGENEKGHISSDQLDSVLAEYGTLYTYGEVSGVWQLLLYSDGVEVAYTINDVAELQKNLTANLKAATLNDLSSMGILTGDNIDSILGESIGDKKIGEMTLSQFIAAVGDLIGD